jgi:hypothetical protein
MKHNSSYLKRAGTGSFFLHAMLATEARERESVLAMLSTEIDQSVCRKGTRRHVWAGGLLKGGPNSGNARRDDVMDEPADASAG